MITVDYTVETVDTSSSTVAIEDIGSGKGGAMGL